MTTVPSLRDLADGAAEVIRTLNHRTLAGSDEFAAPCDVCAVLGALSTLASRLPQLLRQLTAVFDANLRTGRLTVDGWTTDDAATLVAAVGRTLDAAGHYATELGRALDAGHEAAAHLAVLRAGSSNDQT